MDYSYEVHHVASDDITVTTDLTSFSDFSALTTMHIERNNQNTPPILKIANDENLAMDDMLYDDTDETMDVKFRAVIKMSDTMNPLVYITAEQDFMVNFQNNCRAETTPIDERTLSDQTIKIGS